MELLGLDPPSNCLAERITGEALKHSATVGLKAQKQNVGYAALLQQLGRKSLK
jgi:hypothetical protein